MGTLLNGLLLACVLPGAPRTQDPPPPEPIVVGTKEVVPFVMKGADGTWRGLSIQLWEEIADSLGLDYEYRELALPEMLDGVEAGEVDVAVAALTVTAEREERMDFTHAFHTSGLGIAVAAEGGSGWGAVIARVFSAEFLTAIAALASVLLLFGTLVWLCERRRNSEQFGGSLLAGLGSGFWWSAVTMTTVGYGDKAPRTAAGRSLAIVWMFAAVIVISSFTASIASSLTLSRLESSIRGPEDLVGKRVGTTAGSTSADWLVRHNVRPRTYATVDEALEGLSAGRLDAVLYDSPVLRYLAHETYLDALQVLPHKIERQDYAFAVHTGVLVPNTDLSLRKQINREMLRILQSDRWEITQSQYLGDG